MAEKYDSIDAYVAAQPGPSREILNELRRRVHEVAPDATEAISYQIPTFKVGGKPVVYVAGWKSHIAIYPIPACDELLERDIAAFESGKGTLRFALDMPFPYELVDRVIEAALAQRAPASA